MNAVVPSVFGERLCDRCGRSNVIDAFFCEVCGFPLVRSHSMEAALRGEILQGQGSEQSPRVRVLNEGSEGLWNLHLELTDFSGRNLLSTTAFPGVLPPGRGLSMALETKENVSGPYRLSISAFDGSGNVFALTSIVDADTVDESDSTPGSIGINDSNVVLYRIAGESGPESVPLRFERDYPREQALLNRGGTTIACATCCYPGHVGESCALCSTPMPPRLPLEAPSVPHYTWELVSRRPKRRYYLYAAPRVIFGRHRQNDLVWRYEPLDEQGRQRSLMVSNFHGEFIYTNGRFLLRSHRPHRTTFADQHGSLQEITSPATLGLAETLVFRVVPLQFGGGVATTWNSLRIERMNNIPGREQYILFRRSVTIGGAPTDDLILPGDGRPGQQARIWLHGGRLFLQPLSPSIPTRRNGRTIGETVPLRIGDTLSVDDTEFSVRLRERWYLRPGK